MLCSGPRVGQRAGTRLLLAAFLDNEVVGTVQVAAAWPPNHLHRAHVAKLLFFYCLFAKSLDRATAVAAGLRSRP